LKKDLLGQTREVYTASRTEEIGKLLSINFAERVEANHLIGYIQEEVQVLNATGLDVKKV
jgi:hypothetical protein